MSDELKPCPSCGGKPMAVHDKRVKHKQWGDLAYVYCCHIGCMLYKVGHFHPAQWNTRPREDELEAEFNKLFASFQGLVETGHLLQAENKVLREALADAGAKLKLYREEHSGAYIGGVEYTALMKRIETLLKEKE